MKISYCAKGNKQPDFTRQYSLCNYTKYDGSKAAPYNNVIELDVTSKEDMLKLRNIVRSYVHTTFVYKGGARSNANMLEATAFMLDFDNKEGHGDMTFAEWRETELANSCSWIAYSSKSHSKDANCFHVLIPLLTPITDPKLYSMALRKLIKDNSIDCDPAATDAARLFSPGRKPGEKIGDNFFFGTHNDTLFNPSTLVDECKAIVEEDERVKVAQILAYQERRKADKTTHSYDLFDVNLSRVRNPVGQIKAILTKRFGEIGMDSIIDDMVQDIVDNVYISDYGEWIAAGHAIKRYAGDQGQQLWNTLCVNGMTYKEGDEDKYKTFNTDVDYAVQPLLKIALDNGYKPTGSIVSSFISYDRRY